MAMNTYENGSSESRDDDLRRTILAFIQNYMGNDPLEPYLRCIKWLKEMNPPGSVKVVLQEVLELAAKTFVPDKRYKSDLRYLKVWIQYADCCYEERAGVFPYLEANGIGLEHGLFYEAYAMLLESSRDYSRADYVFQIGISRGAQPLERVIAMYNNFRSRMVARQRRKTQQEQEQKALLTRLSGGAMRPLVAENHGIEGLPVLSPFISNAREDPLPDMQDSVGNYGGPAPVLVGSKIYECSTGLAAESSFEEERMRHWIQKRVVSNHEQILIPNSTNTSNMQTRVHQTTSNQYFGYLGDPSPQQAVSFATPQQPTKDVPNEPERAGHQDPLLDDVSLVTKSVTDDILAMFGDEPGPATALQPESRPREHASLPSAHHDVTLNAKSVNDDIMAMFGDVKALDDITIETKSVTDDIMAMFSGSPVHKGVGTRTRVPVSNNNNKSNASYIRITSDGTPVQNGGGRRAPVTATSQQPVASDTESIVDPKLDTSTTLLCCETTMAPGPESMTVGQWVTKETRSTGSNSRIRGDRIQVGGVVQDVTRSTPSRKRSSWSTSAKVTTTQCIYISEDEDESKVQKKPRFMSSTSEGSGVVKESSVTTTTPVVERSLAMREKQRPAQYSPAMAPVASPNGETTFGGVPRNILEPTLSRTEHRKPGGQIYPWDQELISSFLKDLNPPLSKYKGYFQSSKKYSGKVTLASLASTKSCVKNKPLELDCSKYQLKASTGHGAFAQVYLAEALNKTGNSRRVVLKVQKPPCPWEFYIYRQLDMRIPSEERCSFGCAQNIHIYADCSFMECDFGQYGTLQDVINSYLSKGQRMDEPLCVFYTIEMLQMLESLHKVGLIHGDFKPDNLLIRSSSAHLGAWAPGKPGSWKQQGVCLIDWGRSIDLSLFAQGTEFVGDSKTDGFRCTEMIEKKPWTFQVDTYGLCGVVHCLLHGSYMEIEKRSTNAASEAINRPKAPYKRYWNVNLWQNFFETLLNLNTDKSYETLHTLRRSFEDYLGSDSGLTKKLRELLVKQNTMLLSRK